MIKHYLWVIPLFLLLMGCNMNSSNPDDGDSGERIDVAGKAVLVNSCGNLPVPAAAGCQEKGVQVVLRATRLSDSQEHYDIQTDLSGHFTARLPKGQYRWSLSNNPFLDAGNAVFEVSESHPVELIVHIHTNIR